MLKYSAKFVRWKGILKKLAIDWNTMAKKKTKKRSGATTKLSPKRSGDHRQRPAQVANATGKHLVIVESPTKAKTINRYVGSDYVVMASVGHVRDLPLRAPKGTKMPVPGVDLENNFKPTYDILPDKKKTIRELRQAAKLAADVWFATDLDREGEAIAWHLAEALDVPLERSKRVVFNAITESEIQNAFAHPRLIDKHRVNAQQARRILDRIVGYQVSPLLWKKVGGGLSAGRVQSVAVRIVVERERDIEAFTPEEFWKINALLTVDLGKASTLAEDWQKWLAEAEEGKNRPLTQQMAWLGPRPAFKAELIEVDGQPFKCDQHAAALAVAEKIGFVVDDTRKTEEPKAKGPARSRCAYVGHVENPPPYRVRDVQTKRTQNRPSAPFITSTLQQTAAHRFGYPLQRTMRVAQQLYEGIDIRGQEGQLGLITYMRTDSIHLSGESLEMARTFIQREWGNKYLPAKPNTYTSSNRSAQEAHEAIRPTDVTITPNRVRGELTDDQFRLYQLIWERFLACQMAPAAWDRTTVLIDVGKGNAPTATLRARGRQLVFDGFYKTVGMPTSGADEDAALLPPLEAGTPTAPFVIDPVQHFTNPPSRYNEASLQKKLEEEGIGRPSTYAQIIGTIQNRKYVEPVAPGDRRLRATDLGTVVTTMLVDAFPKVMDIAYTRDMEDELDKIESDHHDWISMLHAFYVPFKESLERAHEELTHAKAESHPAPHTCPKCGAETEYRFGRNGRFLSCTAYFVPPEPVKLKQYLRQKFLLYKAKGKARPKIASEDGKTKVGWTTLTSEQKEKFQKLSDKMPQPCKYTAPIDAEGNPIEPQVCNIICPVCGGPMTKRVGRFGPFLGCADYPTCKGIVNIDPKKHTIKLPKPPPLLTELLCPKCEKLLNMRRSKRGPWLSCSDFPKCKGRGRWADVADDKRQAIEQAWQQHCKANQPPKITNTDGDIIPEGYTPQIGLKMKAVLVTSL